MGIKLVGCCEGQSEVRVVCGQEGPRASGGGVLAVHNGPGHRERD